MIVSRDPGYRPAFRREQFFGQMPADDSGDASDQRVTFH
jgi:hypothetical protein